MINILIADDHPLIRQGLRKVLSSPGDMLVVDEATTCHEVFDKIRKHKYDVIILDIIMPGQSGLDIVKDIKNEFPRLAVLILSACPEDQYAVRALKLGASGYLTKEGALDELIDAVRKVSCGGKHVSKSVAERLAYAIEDNLKIDPHEKLSNREYEVMRMIATGKTVKEIAESLFLSEKTIGTYRARVLEKMNLKNNSEITYYAVKHGLIE
ncbi:MAG: response regulator transcription factor [Deltaproteobacteria bacterium]|nr:response regulator transcription factor [Deltaproteobacteria bacterium]